ncbi:unnamed protein product [Caenorhabditis angaria]|uniref:Tim44-like domain-containing protein n=1 Tax=Caenorhabditis angaria TaxID=860376 RepID=A0A9P1IMK6_9PELO|nr:unnamed protein product [Caenorhabditis angaria]
MFRTTLRCFSNAAIASTSTKTAVFEYPLVTVPSFDVTRKFGNIFAQTIYSTFFEKEFSVESLVHGANRGIHSLSHFIAEERWDQMENLVAKETVENLKFSRGNLDKRLENALKFKEDDIVLSFLHSSIISGRDVFKLSKNRNIGIYFTVVSYVRLSENVPEDAKISQLTGKYRNDVLVCNATFSRVLNPLGVWKITNANFFLLQ